MRTACLSIGCVALLGLIAYLSARSREDENVRVRVRLVDAETGKDMAGIVRVFRRGEDKPLALPGLLGRLRGLEKLASAGWYVVPAGGAEATLPRGELRLEALSGLETALARQDLDLRREAPGEVALKVSFLFRPERRGLVAGNTHLHLRDLSRRESDDYLRQVPAADGLKVLFISHLERARDDRHYITNRYPVGDLRGFEATGVRVNNGEEYRHNFGAYGQGYGHVMFLDLGRLVKPASLGPGITDEGDDDTALRPGIDDARRQGATVIWCHNTSGHEDVPSALTGRLDALNVFDGSRTGSYEENYYRYLNIGLRLPISTGTDWFLYDFSRVYAGVKGKPTVKGWLEAVKAGRCGVTNGPLLTLTVDGRPVGETLRLAKGKTVRVEAVALGRHDFRRLELVHNGKVTATRPARREGGGHTARLVQDVKLDGPGWFAARIDAPTRNELGAVLYAHTAPVYVEVARERRFDVEAARGLLRQLEEARADVRARGRFSSPAARDRILALYDEAARDLGRRMGQRGK